MCKGPKVETPLTYSRKSKEAGMTGVELVRGDGWVTRGCNDERKRVVGADYIGL